VVPLVGGAGRGDKITLELLTEWSAFAGEAESRRFLHEIDCGHAQRMRTHSLPCFEGDVRRRLPIRVPGPHGPGTSRVVYARVSDVWRHLRNDENDWGPLPLLERVTFMNICKPGLLNMTVSPRLALARRAAQMQARCETYHALPYPGAVADQPEALMQAFEVVRIANLDVHLREQRAREREMKAMQRQ